jgi:hypothetical protein
MRDRRTTSPSLDAKLIRPLRRLRIRLRWLLVLDACCRLIIALVVCGFVLALADAWVRFPSFVRIGLTAALLCAAGVWSCRRIWRPATAPIHLDQLAMSLQRLPAKLRDRLAAAAAYVRDGAAGSDALWQRVLLLSVGAAEHLPSHRLFSTRSLKQVAAGALLAASVATISILLLPRHVSIALTRFSAPLADCQWPQSVIIEPLTGDAVVAIGESFEVRMRMTRGDRARRRAYVMIDDGVHPPREVLMQRGDHGLYRAAVENVQRPTWYYFAAGDAETSMQRAFIRPVARPAIADASIRIQPPDYAADRPQRRSSLPVGQIRILEGSVAEITILPTVDLSTSGPAEPRVRLDFDRDFGLPVVSAPDHDAAGTTETAHAESVSLRPGADGAWSGEWTVRGDALLAVRMSNGAGLSTPSLPLGRLIVEPDRPPTVAVLEPGATVEATSRARLLLTATVRDDLQVRTCALRTGANESPLSGDVDLARHARRSPDRQSHADLWQIEYEWSLEPLGLRQGDVVYYAIEATDSFALDDARHAPARSEKRAVQIVSRARFADKLHTELSALRDPVHRILIDLDVCRQRAQRTADAADLLDARDVNVVGKLKDLARRAADVADALADLYEGARRNDMADADTARLARTLAGRMIRGVVPRLESAAAGLEARSPDVDRATLAASLADQERARFALVTILDDIQRWNEFETIVQSVRELLDEQEAVMRAAGAGRAEHAAGTVDRLTARQDRLLEQARRLLDAMRNRIAATHRDLAALQALEAALEEADRGRLLDELSKASAALGDRKYEVAARHERGAAGALRAMLSELESRPDRELAELSRMLRDLSERLKKIIDAQKQIIERTAAWAVESPAETPHALADRQFTLVGVTRMLGQRMDAERPEAADAAESLRQAAGSMDEAEAMLRLMDDGAIAHQKSALSTLEAAHDILNRIERDVDQAIAERSLGKIAEALAEAQRRQEKIRAETAAIADRLGSQERPSRQDGLRLNRLAKQQFDLSEEVSAAGEKLAESVVYTFVSREIHAKMLDAGALLKRHESRRAVVAEDAVLAQLALLTDTLRRLPRDDRATFVDDSTGGGGSADAPSQSSPIPPLAELLVLRGMQQALVEKTADLSDALPEPLRRSESQLNEVAELGRRQGQLRDLAEQMLADAAGGGEN